MLITTLINEDTPTFANGRLNQLVFYSYLKSSVMNITFIKLLSVGIALIILLLFINIRLRITNIIEYIFLVIN